LNLCKKKKLEAQKPQKKVISEKVAAKLTNIQLQKLVILKGILKVKKEKAASIAIIAESSLKIVKILEDVSKKIG
jgi:hypothetical protein